MAASLKCHMSATAGTTRDRLAVWEWEEHGEVLAAGDWLVSDAERAAAGQETVAERFRRLLPANGTAPPGSTPTAGCPTARRDYGGPQFGCATWMRP
jgi:hypothetical protein